MQDTSSKQQTKQRYKPNHQQTGLPPHSDLSIRGKTNKNSAQISPYKKLTQTTEPTLLLLLLLSHFSRVRLFVTPWTTAHHQLLELTQIHVHWASDAIQPSCPLSSPSPPALNFSQHQGLFQWVGYEWPKYWSFSFNNSPSNEHPGLISFRMDWLDLLAVQGTLKSLLQHHSSKASILQHSAFFTVQLSHPHILISK